MTFALNPQPSTEVEGVLSTLMSRYLSEGASRIEGMCARAIELGVGLKVDIFPDRYVIELSEDVPEYHIQERKHV